MLHDRAPRLRALIDRDAARDRARDLGVVVVDGGGADDEGAVLQVFCGVPDGDGDPLRAQLADGVALAHVGALHLQAHPGQHLGQRAHGHAADTGQMDTGTGLEKRLDIHSGMHHSIFLPIGAVRRSCILNHPTL